MPQVVVIPGDCSPLEPWRSNPSSRPERAKYNLAHVSYSFSSSKGSKGYQVFEINEQLLSKCRFQATSSGGRWNPFCSVKCSDVRYLGQTYGRFRQGEMGRNRRSQQMLRAFGSRWAPTSIDD